MNFNTVNELIDSLESSGYENFCEYETRLFMLFYDRFGKMPFTEIPDVAFMFMEISSWTGMSLRCGVWQYYESGAFQKGKFERVISFLDSENECEMSEIYACGIHDYANEKYRDNFDYPEEWLDESEKIDQWIYDNEIYICRWMYDLILKNKSELSKMKLG
ncbi:MAG: hypothetical protein K2N72_06125 [Oscillospiraceae bacterium]|nr:hypothetical protein [Oscillospiraceae bacterium]